MDILPGDTGIRQALELARPCRLCPRRCGVDRLAGETGYCKVGAVPIVASAGPHFGEEPSLVGRGGSGTIFLSGCNLLCAFCQNFDISHGVEGRPTGPEGIARIMLTLERQGCENINFVTPTHVAPWLMDAVRRARRARFALPIVYNCGGYEALGTLRLLEGTVDIYMPDAKFWSAETAERYTGAPDYPERMREALCEMQRQVGTLQVESGVARRGLLVRHLVMPGMLDETREILGFIAREIAPDTRVNVMSQYRPVYRAREFPEIARPITSEECAEARDIARRLGLQLL